MKGLFIPDITAEMFRNCYLESIEELMAEGEIYDIEYDPKFEETDVPDTNVGDMISRQDAINTSLEFFVEYLGGAFDENSQKELMVRLQRLSSAERKKGKWIDYSDEGYVECPFCHSDTNCDGNKDELHYCFSCGADMRGEQR